MTRIAVLLATFNRLDKTINCLESLFSQNISEDISIEVFLTDDASSDGTPEAVAKQFPKVNILKGSGSLFWAGGMRNSWSAAQQSDPDFYLLLNDDTILISTALSILLQYPSEAHNVTPAIVIGTTQDNSTGAISYGGHKLFNKSKVQNYNVHSDTEFVECDLANANIMLVPKAIVQKIGILSGDYTHSIADFDYTLTANKKGFKVVVAPGVLGYCTDDHGNNWKSANTSLKDRVKYLKSPKGLAYEEYLKFIKRHFPTHFPAAFLKLWMKTLFPVLWDKFKA